MQPILQSNTTGAPLEVLVSKKMISREVFKKKKYREFREFLVENADRLESKIQAIEDPLFRNGLIEYIDCLRQTREAIYRSQAVDITRRLGYSLPRIRSREEVII